jgi:hypothetical protein
VRDYDATEIAYKNGYKNGYKNATAVVARKFAKLILENFAVSSVPYISGEKPTVTCQLTNWDLNTIIKNIEGEQ